MQSQVRESEQHITELIEAVTELFQKQHRTQELLGKLLTTLRLCEFTVKLPKRAWKNPSNAAISWMKNCLPTTPSLEESVCVCVTLVAKDFRECMHEFEQGDAGLWSSI